MKKVIGIKTKVIYFIIVIILILIVKLLFLNTKKENDFINIEGIATINNPVISPSGKYKMEIVEDNADVKQVKFKIYKMNNGEIETSYLFSSNESFRTRDTLFFIWGDDDKIWVYSGDAGTFYWTCLSDTNWEKHAYSENKNIHVPELLKKLKPDYYN